MTIFDYIRRDAVAIKDTETLMEQFTVKVEFMLSLMGVGSGAGAAFVAKSVYRTARELEHRGIRIRDWKESQSNAVLK